jgi:hypothetical protein
MNRRQLIQVSLMAALAPAGEVHAATKKSKAAGSPKKGLGIGGKSPDFELKLKELRCAWFYTWTGNKPPNTPQGVAFVPMIWKYNGNPQAVENVAAAAKKEGIKELLGYNEPDQSSQANMSVQQALEAWPILQQTGLRLGSPGCVHPDNEWMKSFMEGAKKRDFKVDFVCVHSYSGPNAAAFINRLEAIHKLYKKPIWITEFAVGDWNAKSPAENKFKADDVLKFMEDVLPKLNRLDFVERYAWFPAGVTSAALGTSALWDAEGKLNRLGECYRDA